MFSPQYSPAINRYDNGVYVLYRLGDISAALGGVHCPYGQGIGLPSVYFGLKDTADFQIYYDEIWK